MVVGILWCTFSLTEYELLSFDFSLILMSSQASLLLVSEKGQKYWNTNYTLLNFFSEYIFPTRNYQRI
jgi:hypothetical protein